MRRLVTWMAAVFGLHASPRSAVAALVLAVAVASPAQELRVIVGERHWEASGEARSDTLDGAKDAAVADARARLLRYRRTWVANEIEQEWRERIEKQRPGGDYVEVTTSRTTQKAEGELRGSVVVEASAVQEGKAFVGRALVRCPERTLKPHLRLQALEAARDAQPQAFLDLAVEYGADEPGLAEQTLRLGWARTGAAQVAFALAGLLAQDRRDGEALHFASEALRKVGEDQDLRERIESLVREVNARVPTVAALARDLLTTARKRSTGRSATLTRVRPGRVQLAWPVDLAADQHIVKTWVDHELTLHWRTRDEDGTLETGSESQWDFSWPPNPPTGQGAVCVLWRLSEKAEAWADLAKIENKAWTLDEAASEGERLAISRAMRALVAEATAVAVVELPVR